MPISRTPKSYFIQTYGCAMNYSDTERLETVLSRLGLQKKRTMRGTDLLIFNTCSIKQKAEDKAVGALKQVKEWKKKDKNIMVGFTGCMVRKSSSKKSKERDPLLTHVKQLDFVFRIEDMANIPNLIAELKPTFKVPEIAEAELSNYFLVNPENNSKAQALIPIGTGCDKFCFYCIVPYTRGREKSRALDELFNEAKRLVEQGVVEITLIGQTVNSYGLSQLDKKSKQFTYNIPPFVQLLQKLDTLYDAGLRRVRFTSPYIPDISDEVIEAMATLRTQMPYIHLPIQAGDNRTLKRMNRKYTIEEYHEKMKKIRRRIPGISISTDIIVGYCGETDEEFENTYAFFKKMKWEQAYISQYSQRSGTFASKHMPDDIPRHIKAMRWNRLNTLLREISLKKNKKIIGKTVHVLVENKKGTLQSGRDEHFKNIQFHATRNLVGKIVAVRITKAQEFILEGELV